MKGVLLQVAAPKGQGERNGYENFRDWKDPLHGGYYFLGHYWGSHMVPEEVWKCTRCRRVIWCLARHRH